MLKFIHLTDTHLVGQGVRLYGLDPHHRLKQAFRSINKDHGDAEFVIITGDLTNWGEEGEYQALKDALKVSELPVHLVLGNHDNREQYRNAFPNAFRDENGYVQGVIDTSQGLMIILDTLQEGTHAGWICEERQAWLRKTLAGSDKPVMIFMHHPPCDTGLPDMDVIGLLQKEELSDILDPHKQRVRQIFFGHVHRPIHGSWKGIPISTLRGTNHQVWMDLKGREDGNLALSYEQPAYGVVLVNENSVIIHEHDFLYSDKVYLSDPPADHTEYDYATQSFSLHD